MTHATLQETDRPVWAREDAFPAAPGGYGWLGTRGNHHELESQQALLEVLASKGGEVLLVWTPEDDRMMLPESLPQAWELLVEARKKRLIREQRRAWWWLVVLSIVIAVKAGFVASYAVVAGGGMGDIVDALIHSTMLGVAVLALLILGFIPWYQSWKEQRELREQAGQQSFNLEISRFETWMDLQRAPVTLAIAVVITLVGAIQWWLGRSIVVPPGAGALSGSIWVAGLVKPAYFFGEWWRVFTAPMLHGNLVHFMMNVSALMYLGKRVELFARWPHLLMVFMFAAMAGSVCSAHWIEAPSVGASGGLMGWLGFLLVFESLHGKLVPRSAKRRLFAGLLLTGVIGLVGYRFIDNAAHLGGALAGMGYAAIVFPKSMSNRRPQVTSRDLVGGGVAAVALVGSALTAAALIYSHAG